ncbi:DnaJ family domain-containing protein [Cohnella caldifontis]|uniref:DnaJ family domain-containing protein n=1 Tax=Cohnella caldifontis TaxID=3027471 RepID=UPI0023EC88BD|nr:DnaJ family domain-containing protein [Cohnella sp. YIM B05605]
MWFIASIAEEKIQDSIRRGEFDRLPGKGQPLPPEDDMAGVPEELRLGFKMLKNAGVLPEEMQLRKDMLTLEDLIAACRDETERAKLRSELSVRKLRYQSMMSERGWHGSAAFAEYEGQIQEKLAGPSS